jgi:hypothetical protein
VFIRTSRSAEQASPPHVTAVQSYDPRLASAVTGTWPQPRLLTDASRGAACNQNVI